jgi:hypothetical protein
VGLFILFMRLFPALILPFPPPLSPPPYRYPLAVSAFESAIARLAGVLPASVKVNSVSFSTMYVESSEWQSTQYVLPPQNSYGRRTTPCSTDSAGSCARVWTQLRVADASVTVLSYPVMSCVSDPASDLFNDRLNTIDGMQYIGDSVLRGVLGGGLGVGYDVPTNLRVSLASSRNQFAVTPSAGVAPWSSSLPISTSLGIDIRALPASFPGNTLGGDIAVAPTSACPLLFATSLLCAVGGATFTLEGNSYTVINTLVALNMVAI